MLGWFKKKSPKDADPVLTESGEKEVKVLEPAEAEAPKSILHEDVGVLFKRLTKGLTQTKDPIVSQEPREENLQVLETTEEAPKSILHEDVGVLFKRLTVGLAQTRGNLVGKVDELLLGKKIIDPELLDDLEEILITADLGVETTMALVEEARDKLSRNELADPLALKTVLKERITEFLLSSDKPAELVMPKEGPFVIMVVGVNGVGKTTTIGKMAHKFVHAGQKVVLIAGDTFRAAAVEQLKVWGERINVPVIAQDTGADPASVVFDGMEYAVKRNFDVVIIDTAGRLHTKVNLMEELKKIKRVIAKKVSDAPHEIMLVVDATTGQNAIAQAREFSKTVEITGVALTKLDGTAKGGIVVNICREFDIPIRFIGIGEQLDDLRDFDPQEFVEALFGNTETQSALRTK